MAGADDLDNLIAESLSGVQFALDGERKAGSAGRGGSPSPRSEGEAVKDLQKGPQGENAQNEQFFSSLVRSVQDEAFEKSMASVLEGRPTSSPSSAAPVTEQPDADGTGQGQEGGKDESTGGGEPEAEDYLHGFMKSFDAAVSSDPAFASSLTTLMTSMLSSDLVCEPIVQIVEQLELFLKSGQKLAAAERHRVEAQLRLYRAILGVYKANPDPLPDSAREQVQRLIAELESHGSPPEQVLQKIVPKEAEEGSECFEDFINATGLGEGCGKSEQDLLKKLTENPEELTQVMQEMARQLGARQGGDDGGCKTQ